MRHINKRQYLPRKSIGQISSHHLLKRYRVNIEMFNKLREICGPTMDKNTAVGKAIPLDTKILVALRLISSGKYTHTPLKTY